jgi:hypothetical protein
MSKSGAKSKKQQTLSSNKGGKPNGSILSFFKKTDSIEIEPKVKVIEGSLNTRTIERNEREPNGLFVSQEMPAFKSYPSPDTKSLSDSEREDEDIGYRSTRKLSESIGGTKERFNEHTVSVKRRKVESSSFAADAQNKQGDEGGAAMAHQRHRTRRKVGPFAEDSDSEEEDISRISPLKMVNLGDHITENSGEGEHGMPETQQVGCQSGKGMARRTRNAEPVSSPMSVSPVSTLIKCESQYEPNLFGEDVNKDMPGDLIVSAPPQLKRDATSFLDTEFDDEMDMDEFAEDGEEFVERRYMEEQRRLELADDGFEGDCDGEETDPDVKMDLLPAHELASGNGDQAAAATCPICDASFYGISETV